MERLQRLPWMAVTHRVERLPWRPMAAVWIIWAVGTLGVAGTRFTGKTVPNLHVLQARALLSGRLDIARPDIEGLEHDNLEVVRAKGRYYAPFPIFPAVLLVPLVALLGTTNLAAFILAFALAALTIWLLYGLFLQLNLSPTQSSWLTLGFVVGTGYWLALAWSDGVWFLSHIVAVAAILTSVRLALLGRWPFLAGIALGAAVLSRQMSIYSLPFILALFWTHSRPRNRRQALRQVAALLVPVLAATVIYAFVSYLRFGSPLNDGYASLTATNPGFQQGTDPLAMSFIERYREHGLFNISYVPFNAAYLFLQGPHLTFSGKSNLSFDGMDPFGTSLTFASPFLFAAFAARGHRRIIGGALVALIVTISHQLLFYNNGWVQVNTQRFALDYLPIVIFLVALGIQRSGGRWWKFAIAYAVILNFLGIVALPAIQKLILYV